MRAEAPDVLALTEGKYCGRGGRLPLGRGPNGLHPSALRAAIDCGGRELHIDVVHPSPHVPEAERVAAFASLLETRRSPYVLLGDFNALSDEDGYSAEALSEQMRPYVADPAPIAARMLDRALLASVRASGLVDALAPEGRAHTLPTRLSRPHATQGAQIRIDCILVSRDVRVLHGEIVQHPPTDEVSDHYPVTATIEL